jgi:hypothetical protein
MIDDSFFPDVGHCCLMHHNLHCNGSIYDSSVYGLGYYPFAL